MFRMPFVDIIRGFTPELHKIPARVQCADWIDEPAPPTIP
jgi:hypothetical protein